MQKFLGGETSKLTEIIRNVNILSAAKVDEISNGLWKENANSRWFCW